MVEPEFAEGIAQKTEETGIDIYTHSKVEEINKINDKFQTIFMDAEGETQEILLKSVGCDRESSFDRRSEPGSCGYSF